MKPELIVLDMPSIKSKALYIDGKLIVRADPEFGDSLYLVDEAAEHLAKIHKVDVTYLVCDQSR